MNQPSAAGANRRKFVIITGGFLGQFFFIAMGVFFGMQADQWRTDREHKAAARAALEDFKREMVENRRVVAVVSRYHLGMRDSITGIVNGTHAPPHNFGELLKQLAWRGLRPVSYRHVAWDLSLATQSFSYLPSSLAYRIATVYNLQTEIQKMQDATSAQLLSPSSLQDVMLRPFTYTLSAYLQDITLREPDVIALYDRVIPAIDSILTPPPPRARNAPPTTARPDTQRRATADSVHRQ